MKSRLKPFITNLYIIVLIISSHASALNNPEKLCQLKESQLHSELFSASQLGKVHLESAFSYLDAECQPQHDTLLPMQQDDRKPPTITSWQLSSNDLDLNSGDQTVTLTVRAYDDSGVSSVIFGLLPPNRSYPIPTKRITLGSWAETDEKNIYEASGTLTFKTATDIAGKWRASMMFLRDSNGYYRAYTGANVLKEMGFNPYVTVSNNTLLDSMGPQLRGYSLSSTQINVINGQQTVTAEVLLHDDSGVEEVGLYVAPPKEYSAKIGKYVSITNWQKTQESGVYKGTAELTFNNKDAAGVWRTHISTAYDTGRENTSMISNREIMDFGFSPNIEIINSSNVDTTPPKLLSLSVSTNELKVNQSQQTMTAQVTFYEPSGIKSGYISLVAPTDDYRDNKTASISQWQATDEENVFTGEATFTFDNNDHMGAWYVRSWWVIDENENSFDRTIPNELIAMNINPYVFVNVPREKIKDLYIESNMVTIEGRLERAVPIKLSLKELAGAALPQKFTLSVTGSPLVDVMYDSVSGTSGVYCEFVSGTGNCNFSLPADTLETDIVFNLTPKTTEQNTLNFRLVSDEPELTFTNNHFNISVTGQEPEIYTVKFVDWDGTVISTVQVEEGDTAPVPEITPKRLGYTFIGWDQALSKIAVDTTITAQYQVNTYQVTFKDWDGTVLKQEVVNYSQPAQGLDASPSRVGYTFNGWDHTLSNITADLTVTAQYEINSYQVIFKDWDGTVLKQEVVTYGHAAQGLNASPSRAGYTFNKWDHTLINITENLVITAQYKINTYLVTFMDWDGKELAQFDVNHGSASTAPNIPSREGYRFSGWDKSFDLVTSKLTITAQYSKVANQAAKAENKKAASSSSGSLSFAAYILAFVFLVRRLNGRIWNRLLGRVYP